MPHAEIRWNIFSNYLNSIFISTAARVFDGYLLTNNYQQSLIIQLTNHSDKSFPFVLFWVFFGQRANCCRGLAPHNLIELAVVAIVKNH